MKTLIVILLVLVLYSCEQKSTTPIDNEYFLVGTLSDYMGREKYEKIDNRVDRYYQSEKKLCSSIDSILKVSYPDLNLTTDKNKITSKERHELQSKILAKIIENFYNYEPSKRQAYIGDSDIASLNLDSLTKAKDFYETYFDTVYIGKLKDNVFETDLQKVSFITGAFVRYGSNTDSIYHISIANSASKVLVLDKLLKDIGCLDVEYDSKQDYIPTSHTVYFKPTEKLKSYIEKYQCLK